MNSHAVSSSNTSFMNHLSPRTSRSPVSTRSRQQERTSTAHTSRRPSTRPEGKEQSPAQTTHQRQSARTSRTRKPSASLDIEKHVTRDSMVDSLLLSFDRMPGGPAQSYVLKPKQAPPYTTLENGQFVFDSPKYVYDSARYMRSESPASSDPSSLDDFKDDDVFAKRYTPSYRNTPTRRSTRSITRSTPTSPGPKIHTVPRSASTNPPPRFNNHKSRQETYQHDQTTAEEENMGLGDRWQSRRSRSNSVTLASYMAERQERISTSRAALATASPERTHRQAEHAAATTRTSTQPSARTSAMTSRRTSFVQGESPAEIFKPQMSSREKVASTTGTSSVLADSPYRRPNQSFQRKDSEATTAADSVATDLSGNDRSGDLNSLKERPSFFRRMFGSSRSVNSLERQQSQTSSTNTQSEMLSKARGDGGGSSKYSSQSIYMPRASRERSRPSAASGFGGPILPTGRPPPPVTMPDDDTPRQLNKKASFFRRRRKTPVQKGQQEIIVEVSPQLPPVTLQKIGSSKNSVSSLRKAMSPLLAAADATQHSSAKDADAVSEFALSSAPATPSRQRAVLFSHNATASPPPALEVPATSHIPLRINYDDLDDDGEETPRSVLEIPSQVSRKASSSSSLSIDVPTQPAYPPSLVGARLSQPFASVDPFLAPPVLPSPEKESTPSSGERDDRKAIQIQTRPTLPSRIWLAPSQESVLADPLPTSTSIDSSFYQTPQMTYDSPIISDEYASARQTPVAPNDSTPEKPSTTLQRIKTTSSQIEPPSVKSDRSYDVESVQSLEASVATLGGEGLAAEQRRNAYMESLDFSSMNILQSLRFFCDRLTLKGETQQLDRILSAFSRRWCDCNMSHGFKTPDVVHTICFSLFMLNTDLHVLESDQKMTRPQFLKNTLEGVRYSVKDDQDNDATLRPSRQIGRGSIPWLDDDSLQTEKDQPLGMKRSGDQLYTRPPRPVSAAPSMAMPSPMVFEGRTFESLILVNTPYEGSTKGWEAQIELVLKDFYSSIRAQSLPLHNAPPTPMLTEPPSATTTTNILRRSGSVMSKTPSEWSSSRMTDFRSWNAKSRSNNKPKLSTISNVTTARTSIEDGSSIWSPSGSSTWSRPYGSRNGAAASSDTLATNITTTDRSYHQNASVGFANILGQAVAATEKEKENPRGTSIAPTDEILPDAPLLEDESLALAGAPWAKEGILHHKQHLSSSSNSKARKGNWTECFAVVEKGYMRLFSFNSKASLRSQNMKNKSKTMRGVNLTVGGGNWTESAEALGSFVLRQTLANVLPPPGYAKGRPFCFALTLPDGAVHLFQVGTPAIALEFVSTVNYWSARLSKEPLMGGVSNIEYGWSDAILKAIPNAEVRAPSSFRHVDAPSENNNTSSGSTRRSLEKSRTSMAASSVSLASASAQTPIYPGDRAQISDWTPPTQSLSPSSFPEGEQLLALRKYIAAIELELQAHNDLRSVMLRAYSHKSVAASTSTGSSGSGSNRAKAMANWEKKSSYLLREIVKFGTYVEGLEKAAVRHAEVEEERKEYESAIAAARGARVDDDAGKGEVDVIGKDAAGSVVGLGLDVSVE